MDASRTAKTRYSQFKREQRKESLRRAIFAFIFKLFTAVVRMLRKARIIRRKVETVRVESG